MTINLLHKCNLMFPNISDSQYFTALCTNRYSYNLLSKVQRLQNACDHYI